MKFFLRLLINAVALWCAARFIDGIAYTGTWQGIVGLALVFGFINAFIRPVLNFLSFPIRVLTLGLFTLVINACMLLLTARIGAGLGIEFTIRGFWPALWGAICVSLVSLILNGMFVSDEKKADR
jgi:putative membrane protein